jgi:hypothetical protein
MVLVSTVSSCVGADRRYLLQLLRLSAMTNISRVPKQHVRWIWYAWH